MSTTPNEKSTLYSSHIFMFPFRFDWNEEKKDLNYKSLLSKDWDAILFDPKNSTDNYNQLSYFNTYARDILAYKTEENNQISYGFKRKIQDSRFNISIKNDNKETTYALTVDEVTLNLFFTDVAVLSIKVSNHTYDKFEDILKINDYARRVYPQFLGENGLLETKNAFLANSIELNGVEEDFENLNRDKITIGNHIMALLGEKFSQERRADTFFIEPLLDDRMYVMSWYGNDALVEKLTKDEESTLSDDEWYKYIFVDTDYTTVQNEKMKRELLEDATYFRWQKYNTIFGISKYSYVWLSQNNDYVKDVFVKHMHNLYYPMMLILLTAKASLSKYSNDIIDAKLEGFQEQYEEYLMFYSKLNIQEITHQEQGYELYTLARKQMNIDHLTEKLDNKFTKFFEYSELKANQKSGEAMDNLTIMGAIFLPPSLMIALLSMGIFDYEQSYGALTVGIISIVTSALLTMGILNFKKPIKKRKIITTIAIAIGTLLFVLIPFKLIGEKENKPNDVNITNPTIKVEIKK